MYTVYMVTGTAEHQQKFYIVRGAMPLARMSTEVHDVPPGARECSPAVFRAAAMELMSGTRRTSGVYHIDLKSGQVSALNPWGGWRSRSLGERKVGPANG